MAARKIARVGFKGKILQVMESGPAASAWAQGSSYNCGTASESRENVLGRESLTQIYFSPSYSRAAQPLSWWLTMSHTYIISPLVTVRRTLPAASLSAVPGAVRAPGPSHSSGSDSGLYKRDGNTKKLRCFRILRKSL